MSKEGSLSFVLRNVHDSNIIGVNVDCLVTDNEFFVLLLLISMSKHKDVGISKVKLVFPLGEESVLLWTLLVHSDDEETKLLLELVGKDVEDSIFMIIDDLLHATDLVKLIKINFLFLLKIEIDTILRGGSDHNCLGIIHLEELWLSQKWVGKLVESVDLLGVKVQSDDSISLHENEGVQTRVRVLEVVLHAHFVEDRDVFHNNSFVELIVFVSCLLEHEELVDLLLLHDKVLSRNNSQEFFTNGLSHTNNLIWLSCLSL